MHTTSAPYSNFVISQKAMINYCLFKLQIVLTNAAGETVNGSGGGSVLALYFCHWSLPQLLVVQY